MKDSKLIVWSCRFASSEEVWDVPAWFLDDEGKHRKKPTPVTKEMVEEFKQKWKEIDARPIKRVAEAKARKKRRVRSGRKYIDDAKRHKTGLWLKSLQLLDPF